MSICTLFSAMFDGVLIIYNREVIDGELHWDVKAPQSLKPNSSSGLKDGDIAIMNMSACDSMQGVLGTKAISVDEGTFQVIFDKLPMMDGHPDIPDPKLASDAFERFILRTDDHAARLRSLTEAEYISLIEAGSAHHSRREDVGFSS